MGSNPSSDQRQPNYDDDYVPSHRDQHRIKQSLNLLKSKPRRNRDEMPSKYDYSADPQLYKRDEGRAYGGEKRRNEHYENDRSFEGRRTPNSNRNYHYQNDASNGRVSQMRRANKIPQQYAPQPSQKRHRYSGYEGGSGEYLNNSSLMQQDNIRRSYKDYNSSSIRRQAQREVYEESSRQRQAIKKSPLKDTRSSSEDEAYLPIGKRRISRQGYADEGGAGQMNLYRPGRKSSIEQVEQPQPRIQPKYKKMNKNSEQFNNRNASTNESDDYANNYKPNFKKKQSTRAPQPVIEEERSLDINANQEFDVSEYGDDQNLVECRAGCGRKFLADRVSKHQKICKKVNQRKRKEFNAQKHRMVARDQARLMKKGEVAERKMEEQKRNQQVPKWKAQSIALRARIKMGKDVDYQPTRMQQKMLQQENNQGASSMVDCPYCGRHFNQKAAGKHIPYCKNQQMKPKRR